MLIGGGGHALVIAEAATLAGFTLAGVFDDAPDNVLTRAGPAGDGLRAPFLGDLAAAGTLIGNLGKATDDREWILAVGSLEFRARLLRSMGGGGRAAAVVHPAAHVSATATVGAGVYVGPRAVVHTRAVVEEHAIINSGAVVEHECRVGINSHIGPGAILGGRVAVGSGTLIGLGARVIPGVRIGDGCTVGAGAVVLRDVAAGVTVVGSPARPV